MARKRKNHPSQGSKYGAAGTKENTVGRQALVEFCLDARVKAHTYDEIAVAAQEKFQLPAVPSRPTIMNLIAEAARASNERIADIRASYLAVTIPRLEAIIRNFLPIATNAPERDGRQMLVLRKRDFYGDEVEVIDEDAFQEQKQAAEVVLKTAEQARKLLGIGLAEKNEADDKPVTEARVNALIIQTVNQSFNIQGGNSNLGPLELTSGDAQIDALEDTGV